MCVPSSKQVVTPTTATSPHSTGSPENLHPSPTGTGTGPGTPNLALAPLSLQYGNFTNSAPPDPASTRHLLQKRDYQNNNLPQNDSSDDAFRLQTRSSMIGKLRDARHKLVSYFRHKSGVIMTGAVFIIFFNIIGWMGCYSLLFVSLQEEFGRNATETGWVGSLAFIVNCLCTPFSDLLLRRFSHRTVCIVGIISCAISLLSSSFMPKLYYLFFTFGLLYGLGSGLVFKSCLDLLLNHLPDNCGRASFLVLTGSTSGIFAWTPINTVLIDLWGWRNACRISSAIILIVCLIFTFPMTVPSVCTTKESPDQKDASEMCYAQMKSKKKMKKGAENKDEIKWSPPRGKNMARMPEAWLFGLACFSPFIGMGFYNVNLMSYATSMGYSSNQGATVLTIAAASEAGSKLIFAIFVDKLPFRKVHLMAVLSVFSTVVSLSCAFVPSFPIMCVVAVGIGVSRATCNALPFPVGMEIFGPVKTSGSNTLILFTGGLGTITSAFAIGGTFDAFGSYNVAIYICTGFFLLTAILYFFIPFTSKLYKVTGVKVRFNEVTGTAEMVPVVKDEVFMIEEFVTVV